MPLGFGLGLESITAVWTLELFLRLVCSIILLVKAKMTWLSDLREFFLCIKLFRFLGAAFTHEESYNLCPSEVLGINRCPSEVLGINRSRTLESWGESVVSIVATGRAKAGDTDLSSGYAVKALGALASPSWGGHWRRVFLRINLGY